LQDKIERVDQRFLTAKIQVQWLLAAEASIEAVISVSINVRAAKTIDGLLAIADDKG
jgi:hypothetical protein